MRDFTNFDSKLVANFGAIQYGTLFGWTAAALPYLRTDERGLVTSIMQESWITSIMAVGSKYFKLLKISILAVVF